MINQNTQPGNRDPAEKNFEFELMKQKAITQCYDWFDKDRSAKSYYNEEMDEMYKLYKSAHWDLFDETGNVLRTDAEKRNHPNAVENVTFSLIEGLVAEFSEPKELIDYPTEPNDEDAARQMTDIKEAIAYKNRIDDEYIKWLRNFFWYGSGIWEHNWDDDWKGGRGPNRWKGDVRWRSRHPRSIFPDARCHESIHDGRRLHDATYWTIEELQETFPDTENITSDSVSSEIIISDELEDISAENVEDQVLVVITWYKGKPLIMEGDEEDEGPGLHYIMWAGDSTQMYLKHGNYVYFEPGEDVKFPFTAKKCYERENSPWGYGEAYFLKNPQMVLNKTSEMIIEGHLFYALGQTWYEEGAVSEKQKREFENKGMLSAIWLAVNRVDGIKREYGKGVPSSLENESGRIKGVMESIIGRFDVTQGKTPSSVTAFRALDLLASRAQVRLRSKEMAINTGYEDSGNYINRIVAENYTEKRRYRIMGKDDKEPVYGLFEPDRLRKAYLFQEDASISMDELESLTANQEGLPEEEQLIEGRDYELYSPEFDTRCKVTSKMPSDRVFYMEMAKELFSGGAIDIETFFYVIENGKFPPIEKILEKLQQNNQDQEQEIMQFVEWVKTNKPEIMQKLSQIPEEQRIQYMTDLMQKMIESGEYQPGQQTPAAAGQMQEQPQNADIPVDIIPDQNNPDAIRQQLIDIAAAQEAQQ